MQYFYYLHFIFLFHVTVGIEKLIQFFPAFPRFLLRIKRRKQIFGKYYPLIKGALNLIIIKILWGEFGDNLCENKLISINFS